MGGATGRMSADEVRSSAHHICNLNEGLIERSLSSRSRMGLADWQLTGTLDRCMA